jgi:hypothetical protein
LTYKNFITIKFRFWAFDWALNPRKYNFFELKIKFYIKSSSKTSKLLNTSRDSDEKESKICMKATRRNLFLTEFVADLETELYEKKKHFTPEQHI